MALGVGRPFGLGVASSCSACARLARCLAESTVRPLMRWQEHTLALAAPFALAAGLLGCSPKIGDHCIVNSDCSLQGNLECDTSQPNGYCTLFGCTSNSCQNNAACVTIGASVPGCPYNDYQSPSRTSLNLCLASCGKDSDCRTGEGYVCRDPRQPPWNAVIIDNDFQRVCVPLPTFPVGDAMAGDATTGDAEPAVCLAAGPELDGNVFSSADAGSEAPEASAMEGGAEGGEAGGSDAGVDAASVDAASDAAADSGAVDAADGG